MRALPVVAEEEGGEFVSRLIGRIAGPGAFIGDAQPSQDFGATPGFEGRPVVGRHALDRDDVAAEDAQGVEEDGEAGASLLVGMDLGTAQPGMIRDGQV